MTPQSTWVKVRVRVRVRFRFRVRVRVRFRVRVRVRARVRVRVRLRVRVSVRVRLAEVMQSGDGVAAELKPCRRRTAGGTRWRPRVNTPPRWPTGGGRGREGRRRGGCDRIGGHRAPV